MRIARIAEELVPNELLEETPDTTGLIGGRFEVVRTLGDGAFAVVYEAIDRELGRRVALKLFNRYAPDELDLALREARAMAKLNHANVLAVHDIGEHRGTPFLALEYAETDLHRWLTASVRDPAKILALLVDAGHGLAAAHRAGLVHHDFKPANVMMRGDGSVAVGDFGLARHLDSQDDESVALGEFALGTLRYISPERLLGHVGDPRSDQFSFCVALWEALCGAHPFTGMDAQRRYDSIASGPDLPKHRPTSFGRCVVASRSSRAPDSRTWTSCSPRSHSRVFRAAGGLGMYEVGQVDVAAAFGLAAYGRRCRPCRPCPSRASLACSLCSPRARPQPTVARRSR
jgi:serine/threonine protein kinase